MTIDCCTDGKTLNENLSEALNSRCACTSTSKSALANVVAKLADNDPRLCELAETHPHLFSEIPVYVSQKDFAGMKSGVAALERTIDNPKFQQMIGATAPNIAHFAPGPVGAMMGYDFHLTQDGPKLIEINTNAGGAFLNAALYEAQTTCCTSPFAGMAAGPGVKEFSARVIDMFLKEWTRQGRDGAPKTIAIIDDAPDAQYLYPEFLLVQRALKDYGIGVEIADPAQLTYENNLLLLNGQVIDLVYNRLVDFYLDAPKNTPLKLAYLADATVVTPNPRAHALYARKANLSLFASSKSLENFGVSEADRKVLANLVPATEVVNAEMAPNLWARRKSLFFKPVSGHGGKAVFRGDKITKSAWQTVLAGDYIAQSIVSPSHRTTRYFGSPTRYKADIRLFTYDGEVLLAAARLYQGQTTNFRTPGGGFAPVYVL